MRYLMNQNNEPNSISTAPSVSLLVTVAISFVLIHALLLNSENFPSSKQNLLFNTFIITAGFIFIRWSARRLIIRRCSLLYAYWFALMATVVLTLRYLPRPMEGQFSSIAEAVANSTNVAATTSPVNYPGAAYIYGALYKVSGVSGSSAALVNALLALIMTILIALTVFRLFPLLGPKKWTILFLPFLPTGLIYASDIGKEPLCAFAFTISCLFIGRYFFGLDRFSRTIAVVAPNALLLAAVRPTTVLVLPIYVVLLFFFAGPEIRSRTRSVTFLFLFLLTSFPLGIKFNSLVGGRANIPDYANQALSGNLVNALNIKFGWVENSIGALLTPHSTVGVFLTAPIRGALYLIAPVGSSLPSSLWQAPLTPAELESLVQFAASATFCLTIGGLVLCIIRSFQPIFHWFAIFWIPASLGLLLIGFGTIIIHVRYRVTFEPLLFCAIWIGFMSMTKRSLLMYFAVLAGLIALCAPLLMHFRHLIG